MKKELSEFLKTRESKEFKVEDPLNDGNIIEGIIFRDVNHYGDLLITKVNDKKVDPQYIHTTPKFFYPGNTESMYTRYKIDIDADELRIYDKLDGTNIFVYEYHDAEGNSYITMKTRLTPVIRNSTYIPFLDYAKKTITDPKPGQSYELYGYLNPILVKYDVPIDAVHIFTIDNDGNLYPPEEHDPSVFVYWQYHVNADTLERLYTEFQDRAEREFLENKSREGYMFYIRKGDKWMAWKCKSPSAVHISKDLNKLSEDDVYTTARNSLEDFEGEITIDNIIKNTIRLLKENSDINTNFVLNKPSNKKIIEKVAEKLYYQIQVVNTFREKCNGMTDPREIMRMLSKYFNRRNMQYVYSTLKMFNLI